MIEEPSNPLPEINTVGDIKDLLAKFNGGEITDDECMTIIFLNLAIARSEGFEEGFESAKKRYKI